MTATPPRRLTQRLSAAFVRTAEPGFYCDGHGLNLRVESSGARQWVRRLVIRGRPRMLWLGSYPVVSLAEARDVAFANRKRARAGGDPLAEKRHDQGVPTVEEAAAVPHGFRSNFRDWAAERTSTPREMVEAALAHTVQNPTEAVERAVISSSAGAA